MAKELLFSVTKKDLEVQTFRSGGPGGQNQNKTESGVRIIHRESGGVGESRTEKSQLQNKRNALKRLSESSKFKIWMNKRVWEITNKKTIEQIVAEKMSDKNLKVEGVDEDGKWVEIKGGNIDVGVAGA